MLSLLSFGFAANAQMYPKSSKYVQIYVVIGQIHIRSMKHPAAKYFFSQPSVAGKQAVARSRTFPRPWCHLQSESTVAVKREIRLDADLISKDLHKLVLIKWGTAMGVRMSTCRRNLR